MKYLKFISICLMASFAMSVSAAVTAKATINVYGDDPEDAAELSLVEDPAAAANFADPNNGFLMASNNVFMPGFYAENGTKKYSAVVLPSLKNVVVKFVANAYETDYTMSFSGVTGNIILVNGTDTAVVKEGETFSFQTSAVSEEVTFTVNPQSEDVYTRTVTSGSYGTICLPWASTKIEGATMYEVLGLDLNQGVALGEFLAAQQMVAGTPYVFKATAAELKVTYTGAAVTDTVVVKGGFFGSFAGMDVVEGKYILYNNMLYQAGAGCSILANRAFFDLDNMEEYDAQQAQGRKVVFMGTEATGLNAVKAAGAKAQKVMINGQMVIIRDGKMFNAQGAEL